MKLKCSREVVEWKWDFCLCDCLFKETSAAGVNLSLVLLEGAAQNITCEDKVTLFWHICRSTDMPACQSVKSCVSVAVSPNYSVIMSCPEAVEVCYSLLKDMIVQESVFHISPHHITNCSGKVIFVLNDTSSCATSCHLDSELDLDVKLSVVCPRIHFR